MSRKLTLLEITALTKELDKQGKAIEKLGDQVITPGNHQVDFSIQVDGSLSRGEDTEVSPNFSMNDYLKALLLKYASNMDKNKGREWLRSLMDLEGALGAILQLGPDAVIKTVDPALIALYDGAADAAKEKFKAITKKKPRAGNTVVVLNLEVLSETSEPIQLRTVRTAKKKN